MDTPPSLKLTDIGTFLGTTPPSFASTPSNISLNIDSTPENIKETVKENQQKPLSDSAHQSESETVDRHCMGMTPPSIINTPVNVSTPDNLREQLSERFEISTHSLSGSAQPSPTGKHKHSKRSLDSEFTNMEVPKKRGRKPYHDKYPEIVPAANAFLQERGLAAHERRRTETADAIGTSASDLRLHLINTIEDLPMSYSASSARRLMKPPHVGRKSSKLDKGLVNARIGKKTNTLAKKQKSTHYLRCRVKFALEMGALFTDEVQVVSADAKDKLRLGGPVVSRHIKVKDFSLLSDSQEIPDHDFPSGPGYKYTPDGYMFLRPKKPCRRKRRNSWHSGDNKKGSIKEAMSQGSFDDIDLPTFADLHKTNKGQVREDIKIPNKG